MYSYIDSSISAFTQKPSVKIINLIKANGYKIVNIF